MLRILSGFIRRNGAKLISFSMTFNLSCKVSGSLLNISNMATLRDSFSFFSFLPGLDYGRSLCSMLLR